MQDGEFEWDESKAAENEAKHHVTFAMARGAFDDPFVVEWPDERENYGEDRVVTVGMVEGRLLTVISTLRGVRIRIISARGATPHERRKYHEENKT
jgi:uncharacterized DUF497 family protein